MDTEKTVWLEEQKVWLLYSLDKICRSNQILVHRKKNFNKFYGTIPESRIHAIREQSSINFAELFWTKYWALRFFHEISVFCPEKFRKFYRTLFSNRLYPQLLNSSKELIEQFFSVWFQQKLCWINNIGWSNKTLVVRIKLWLTTNFFWLDSTQTFCYSNRTVFSVAR